uniref:Uncharacterized protein n=1 Tax=Klebsiella pneumoniae CG43 TaxID=1244085 RepID=Q6U5U9_KLEPN|nr:hypothetical protein LV213 [Klebsiella pneumoniae CG43]
MLINPGLKKGSKVSGAQRVAESAVTASDRNDLCYVSIDRFRRNSVSVVCSRTDVRILPRRHRRYRNKCGSME